MNGRGKSDSLIVPKKLLNKGSSALRPEEGVEGRGLAKRGIRINKPGSGHRAGTTCNMRWCGYGRQRVGVGSYGSQRSGITSAK